MMFRVQIAFLICFLCTASSSFAADFPTHIEKTVPVHHKKTGLNPIKITSKPQQLTLLPADPEVPAAEVQVPIVKHPKPIASTTANLSWVLGPMAANADGGKREASASATANIVVDKPGTSCGPEMVIELQGHVVKTTQSTVRIDVQIGDVKKSIRWNADEIKSGIFKITLKEKVPAGVLPSLIPVSALAFVTQAGEGHVAMVSLEKIVLRFSGQAVLAAK